MNSRAPAPDTRSRFLCFEAAIVAMIAFTLGLFIGLAMDVLVKSSVGQLREENHDLSEKLETTRTELAKTVAARQTAEWQRNTLKEKGDVADKKAVETEAKLVKYTTEWMKLNALLCMVRDNHAARELIRHPSFAKAFTPDWYRPDESYRLLGGRWFLIEVRVRQAAPQEVLDTLDQVLADGKP